MTKLEIDDKYIELVKQLEIEYFDFLPDRRALKDGKSIGEFNTQQSSIWKAHEVELVAGGFLQPKPDTNLTTDWKALWLAADTAAKKLSVIAKRLGLE